MSYNDKASLVERVKAWQRQSASHKEAWYRFVKQGGSDSYDPNRHDESVLLEFVQSAEAGQIELKEPKGDSKGGGKGGGKGGRKALSSKDRVSEFICMDETVFAASGPDALRWQFKQIETRTGASVRVKAGLNGKYVTVSGHLEQVRNAVHRTKLLLETISCQETWQRSLSSEQQALIKANEAPVVPQACDPLNVNEAVDTLAGKVPDEAQREFEPGQESNEAPAGPHTYEPANVDTASDEAQQDGIDSDGDFADCFQESEQSSVPQMQETPLDGEEASHVSQLCSLQSVQQSEEPVQDDIHSDLDFADCNQELERRYALKTHGVPLDITDASDVLPTCGLQMVQRKSEPFQDGTDVESDVDFTDWEIPEHWKQDGLHMREVDENNGTLDDVIESSPQKSALKSARLTATKTKNVAFLSPPDSDKENAPKHSLAQPLLEKDKQLEQKDTLTRDAELASRLQKEEEQVCCIANRRPPPPPLPSKAKSNQVAQPGEKRSREKSTISYSGSATKADKHSQRGNAQLTPANVPTPSRAIFPGNASTERVFESKNVFLHLASASDTSDDEKKTNSKSGGSNKKGKQAKSKDPSATPGSKVPLKSGGALAKSGATASNKSESRPVEAMNPLPQRSRASYAAFVAAERAVIRSENSATSLKWKERPVEKIQVGVRYEDEEDPELARYIWNPTTQRPLLSQGRPQPKAKAAIRPVGSLLTTNSQRQRQSMVNQVVEMGFDPPSAQRALAATNWASVDVALNALLS